VTQNGASSGPGRGAIVCHFSNHPFSDQYARARRPFSDKYAREGDASLRQLSTKAWSGLGCHAAIRKAQPTACIWRQELTLVDGRWL
jgi:hypothetical protein